ncbi:PREDICTED: growth/differentiation factor 15 [Elephantulus edwardii]|uniref:growth/differentiation factor 15 n=1 Tax=Elephantulus edwardii TaxID=28737 RepID=UPI0003F0EBC9|nr:PREDICTED: growth/differentiation factor 15 [Elephantulus edwardii]
MQRLLGLAVTATSTAMPWLGRKPLHRSPVLLLLLSLLPPEGALSSVLERSPGQLRPPGLETSRFWELHKHYEKLMKQLHVNQSWEEVSSGSNTAAFVWILTPELRLSPSGHSYLRIPRAALPVGHPAVPRLHQALLRLSPTTPSPRDVTRPLKRLLAHGNSASPVLRLPAPQPWDLELAAQPSTHAHLELHLRAHAARGRRNTHARTAEAWVAGATNCCGVQSPRVTLEELGWTDWARGPKELNLRARVGACPPRSRSVSAHARIKTRLHNLDRDSFPAPCCVPSSFEPVVLMHRDSNARLTLTSYKDILVKDCHCA